MSAAALRGNRSFQFKDAAIFMQLTVFFTP